MARKSTRFSIVVLIAAIAAVVAAFMYVPNIHTVSTKSADYSGDMPYNSVDEAISALKTISISETDDELYDRSEFGDWSRSDGRNTRTDVLATQSNSHTMEKNKVVSGCWSIPYTGETVTYDNAKDISRELQIDHIVPVSYAFHHGASSWDTDKRQEFYNDSGVDDGHSVGDNGKDDIPNVGNLVVSDRRSNISKSDSGPSEWMPSNESYWVSYCESWTKVCSTYGISLSKADYDKIMSVLESAR